MYEIIERNKLQKIEIKSFSTIFSVKVLVLENDIYYQWEEKLGHVLEKFKKQGKVNNPSTRHLHKLLQND